MASKRFPTRPPLSGVDLAAAARRYLEVPFVHASRNEWGVDCVGLLLCAAHALQLTDYDNVNYNRIVNTSGCARRSSSFVRPSN